MDDIKAKMVIIEETRNYLDKFWAERAKNKIVEKIENIFRDHSLRSMIREQIIKIVNATIEEDTHRKIKNIIRETVRPHIIYIQEQKAPPPQICDLPVVEYFVPPSQPGIYFLCREDTVVYIGQSVSVGGRISQHVKDKNFDRVFFMPVDKRDLDLREMELIHKYCPELNKTHNQVTK